MISEEQQDQAALYVLGSLDANEVSAFESAMGSNAELRDLVRELREAAGDMALSIQSQQPPAALKQRVMRDIAMEKQGQSASPRTSSAWLPWAIAALFLIFCGVLAVDRARMQRELAAVRATDPMTQTTLFTLAPSGPGPADAKATVAWHPGRQSGVIRISNLPPQPGKDYQLWAVDANHKDPVSAGIIHVDQNGVAQVQFKPVDAAQQVKAFAISVERVGGVPKAEGPIILVGSA